MVSKTWTSLVLRCQIDLHMLAHIPRSVISGQF